MVTFDHRDPGTAETRWAASTRWSSVPHLDASPIPYLVVVAAHPDDETLGAAGLMQRVASAGGDVCVVLATDGEASHPDSPTHHGDSLRALRVSEVTRALAVIAPEIRLVRLGLPDGALQRSIPELREGIRAAVAAATGAVTIVATWRGDGHGDHRTVGEISAEVANYTGAHFLEYPIWMWHWATPDDPRVPWSQFSRLTLDATEYEVKQRALGAHVSQTGPLSPLPGDEPLLHAGFLAHFDRSDEIYLSNSTTETQSSMSREYFESFYAGKTDPWGFEDRWYERRKREITMASLPRERFGRALEIGCSIGVLTERLAERCDEILATDIAPQPLELARVRLREHPHVRFSQVAVHESWPSGEFDLIVVSEVGYYLNTEDLTDMVRRAANSLTPGGTLLACHWRHPVRDYPLTGDQVHDHIRATVGLEQLVRHDEEDFVLEVYGRSPAPSVARANGLA